MHTNKVSSVKTLNLVAKELGEDEDWLFDVAAEMEPEDGVIWVYGISEDGVLLSPTSASRASLDSSKCTKTTRRCSGAPPTKSDLPAAHAGCVRPSSAHDRRTSRSSAKRPRGLPEWVKGDPDRRAGDSRQKNRDDERLSATDDMR